MVHLLCDSVARMFGQEESGNDMTSKRRRRHTPDRIFRKLVEGNNPACWRRIRNMTRRTAAREARRAGGQSIGRPKALDAAKAALASRMQAVGEPVTTISAALGVSRATVYQALAEEGE